MIGKLAQLPGREKTGLIVALALMALYVADLTVAKPLVRRLRKLDAAIVVENQRLDHCKKTVRYEKSVERQYAAVKDLLGVSGAEQETIEIFKNEIDELAQRHAVRLKTMRHLTPERTEFLVTYIVEISDFEAEAPALIHFLHGISQAPGLIRVRQATLSSQSADPLLSGSLVVTKVMTRPGGGEAP